MVEGGVGWGLGASVEQHEPLVEQHANCMLVSGTGFRYQVAGIGLAVARLCGHAMAL